MFLHTHHTNTVVRRLIELGMAEGELFGYEEQVRDEMEHSLDILDLVE